MPVHTGSVQDELLRLSGSSNNPYEVVTETGYGTAVYFGPDRDVQCRLKVSGAVSGTNPTLDVIVQRCTDSTGASPETVASFAQVIASQAAVTGSLAEDPVVTARTTAARPWLRIGKTIGGTSVPTFNGFGVLTDPVFDVVA